MKTTKVAKDKLKDHGESKPTTQKAIQIKQSNKIKEIMSTFSVSKPTNVDAQRIVCVLDTLIEKVQVLQYLDNDLVNSINDKTKAQEKEELLAQLSNNAHLLLTRELDYEAQLKPLLSGQDSIDKTADEGSPTIDLGSMIGTTAKNLRNLVRDLQNSPDDLEIVKRLRRNNPLDDYEDFLTYLRGMRLLMLRRLSTSVEEQASHDRQKQELDRKILLWERTKNNKELELRNLKKEKEKYITEKDEELNKLKNLIEEVEMNKSTQLANIKAQSEIEKEAMEKNSKEKEVSLKNRLSTLETELKDLRKKNKDEEQSLREKKGRDEGFLKEIMEQYDEMMESKEQEVHELESELQKVEKEIKDYKESLAILKKEEEKEKEIDKQIVEKKELQKTEKDRIDKIVQSIQDAWKIYKVKAKVGKKKKGKGKDAKGKDGKGGKDAKGKDAKGKTTKR